MQVCEGMAKAFFGFFYVCSSDIFVGLLFLFFFLFGTLGTGHHNE